MTERRRAVRRVGGILVAINAVLVLAKAAVWLESGSLAVGSEAVNSLTDTVYSLVILAGIVAMTRPPDREHPHGHERIEPFVSLVVALGMVAAGGAVLWNAVLALAAPAATVQAAPLVIAVLVGSAATKLVMARWLRRVGHEQQSPVLTAVGIDARVDVLTAVVAIVGVAGASVGLRWLDPLAAAVVAVGIFYSGYDVVRENVNYLIGAAPPEELRAAIIDRALAFEEVRGAHDVIAHYVGPQIDVSLHIEVEGDMTMRAAHHLETEVVTAIGALPGVDDVFVHIDPRELSEWKPDEGVTRDDQAGSQNA